MLNSDVNVASGSYNAALSDDYSKKLIPSGSKNLAVAKYNNNKQDCESLQLNTPWVLLVRTFQFKLKLFFALHFCSEDVTKQLDTIQGDLDSLKELFQADNDYSLDANALFGVSDLNS